MFPIKEYPGHAKFRGLIKSFVRSNNNENMMMETNFGGGFYEVEFEDGDVAISIVSNSYLSPLPWLFCPHVVPCLQRMREDREDRPSVIQTKQRMLMQSTQLS